MMTTPIPAQLEHWLKIVNNKKSPNDLREQAVLHLTTIRDTIDKSLRKPVTQGKQYKNENRYTR
jgi:hypothetical protein